MKVSQLGKALVAAAVYCLHPDAASAQPGWAPASEIVGLPMQVTTDEIVNFVRLNADGSAVISTRSGRSVEARWTAGEGRLCLVRAARVECWPYNEPFRAGQPVTMTSSCNSISTWLASATNPLPSVPAAPAVPSQPPAEAAGERGR